MVQTKNAKNPNQISAQHSAGLGWRNKFIGFKFQLRVTYFRDPKNTNS